MNSGSWWVICEMWSAQAPDLEVQGDLSPVVGGAGRVKKTKRPMLGGKGSLVSEMLTWNVVCCCGQITWDQIFIQLNPHLSHALLRVVRVHSALPEAFSENTDGGMKKGREEWQWICDRFYAQVGCGWSGVWGEWGAGAGRRGLSSVVIWPCNNV